MSSSPIHQRQGFQKNSTSFHPILRHLNTGTVAFLLFFGLALVSIIRGKEPEATDFAPVKTRTEDSSVFTPCSALPRQVSYRSESAQGSLKVYSATDEFNDGDAWYFPHSSYIIYSSSGKAFKNVENHTSRSDEIPEVVLLPVGYYAVAVRSEQDGYVRVPVVIKEGQQTILHLDLREYKTPRAVSTQLALGY
jgi:hypothetical protein